MKNKFIILTFFLGINAFSQAQEVQIEDLVETGKNYAAIEVLEEKIGRNNGEKSDFLLLGDLYSFLGKWDEAIDNYTALLKLDPENAEYNFKYGGALGMKALEVSRFRALTLIPDVKMYLEKAAAADPSHVRSRRALVELYMQLPGLLGGSEEKAKRFAGELHSSSAVDAMLAMGYIHAHAGRENQAKDLYRQAISSVKPVKDKSGNYLNYELGEIAAKYQLEPEKGLDFLNIYLTNYSYRDIHLPEWGHYRKAQIHAFLRNRAEAKRSIDRALALNKNFEEAKKERERILKM